MKKFTLVGLSILFSLTAAAEDGPSITDLQFFPLNQAFYANVSDVISSSSPSYTVGLLSPTSFDQQTLNSNALNFLLGYGVLERLNVSIQDLYYFSSTEQDKFGPASSQNGLTQNLSSNGLADPTLTATYRILEQKDFFLITDVFAGYSPQTISANTASPSQTGTKGRGGSELLAGLTVGHKFSGFEFDGTYEYGSYSNRTTTSLLNNQLTVANGGSPSDFAINLQFDISKFIQLVINYTNFSFSSETDTNQTTSSITQIGSYNITQFGGGLNFQVLEEKLLVQLAFGSFSSPSVLVTASGSQIFFQINSGTEYGVNVVGEF